MLLPRTSAARARSAAQTAHNDRPQHGHPGRVRIPLTTSKVRKPREKCTHRKDR